MPEWSITTRLALHFLASTSVLLLMAAGFLYYTLKHNLEQNRHAMLASKLQVFRGLLREQPAKAAVLASEVEHEAAASSPFKYYLRILDEQGNVRLETPGIGQVLPLSQIPPPISAGADPLRNIQKRTIGPQQLLILAVRAPVGERGETSWTLQMVMDVSIGASLLAHYRNGLLLVLAVGSLFAAVMGLYIARRGMRPLAEITHVTQHITATQLHERIAGARWPRELAQLASAFDSMLDRLEDSFTRLSQYSADLAHELRTPINNLRGEAEVALTRSRTVEDYQQILASSLEEYDRLARMIDGLLFLARADDPTAVVQPMRFDARKQLEVVQEFYEPLSGEKGVSLKCEGSGWITADPQLFQRAVNNLVANALQYTAQGSVCLSVRQYSQEAAQVCVTDTGRGIAPEHLPKIFHRFYRGGLPRSQASGGSGLGLAIVQSIMRLHGGTATIESAVGKGTTVILNFPAPVSRGG